jgi:polyisoprenoid-binding protein YceI
MTISLSALCAGCMASPAPPPPAATAAASPAPAAPPAPKAPMAMPKFVPPSRSPASVPSGTYALEPMHTQVMFSVMHFGVSPFYGTFSGASGTLTVDAKDPARDTLKVRVPIDSLYTTSAKLTGELKSSGWFDAAQYPNMTFESTKVIPTGKTTARVMGDLTMHGVTRPVTLNATFVAAGVNPMLQKLTAGFTATGTIKRSDFGVSTAVPLVSDETKIIITAPFVAE